MSKCLGAFFSLAVILFTAGGLATAGSAGSLRPSLDLVQGGLLCSSLDDAVSGIRRGNPGRVLSADQVDRDGRREYRIKILTERGEVRRFRIDGDSGRALPRPDQGATPWGRPWPAPGGR